MHGLDEEEMRVRDGLSESARKREMCECAQVRVGVGVGMCVCSEARVILPLNRFFKNYLK